MATATKSLDAKAIQTDIERYKRLIATQPELSEKTVPIHLTLAKLYERAGEKSAAVQEFGTISVFYADQGNIIKAMAAAQLIVRIDPKNDELLDRLGELYFLRKTVSDDHLKEYQESLKHIEALQSGQQEPVVPDTEEVAEETHANTKIDVVAALKQISLFAKLSVSELRGIQANSFLRNFAANEPIITGGNVQRSLFAILQGSVKIFGRDNEQRPTFLAALHAGTSFGEFALFGRIDTNLAVMTDQATTILEIPRELVLKLAKTRPQVTEALKDLYKRRILENALARVPLFSQLTPQDRQSIIPHFKPVGVKQGTIIVREAEPGNSMYFIASGELGVYTSLTKAEEDIIGIEEEQLLLATLKSGDFFGEQALITNETRSATVTALTDGSLLKLSKGDLAAVIKEHPGIESALQIEAFQKRMQQHLSILNKMAPGHSV